MDQEPQGGNNLGKNLKWPPSITKTTPLALFHSKNPSTSLPFYFSILICLSLISSFSRFKLLLRLRLKLLISQLLSFVTMILVWVAVITGYNLVYFYFGSHACIYILYKVSHNINYLYLCLVSVYYESKSDFIVSIWHINRWVSIYAHIYCDMILYKWVFCKCLIFWVYYVYIFWFGLSGIWHMNISVCTCWH